MQQRFDPDRLEVSGEATPVAEQVFYSAGVARGDFSLSSTGVLAYRSGTNRSSQFAWFDRTGKMLETVGAPGNYRTADLSPDGQRLAYADVNLRDIWILDLSRQSASRFTSDPGTETAPVWFPDGNKIAYRSDFGGLFEKDLAGSGTGRLLLKQPVNGPDQVSSDGKWILYFLVTPGGNQDVYVLPTTGDPKPQMIVQTPFPDVEPQFSPDVRWLAYASSENGPVTRCTSRRSPRPAGGGRCPAPAATSRCGGPMARNCSLSATSGGSTRSTCRRRTASSSTECRSFSSTCAPTSSTCGTAISPIGMARVSS